MAGNYCYEVIIGEHNYSENIRQFYSSELAHFEYDHIWAYSNKSFAEARKRARKELNRVAAVLDKINTQLGEL